MLKYFNLLLIVLFTSTLAKTQNRVYIYYFDSQFNTTDSTSAFYYAKGANRDSLFTIYLYLKTENQLLGVEQYTDSTLTIKQGSSMLMQKNGNPQSLKTYKNNQLDGISIDYDEKSRPTDSAVFNNNQKTFASHYSYHKQGHPSLIKREDLLHKITEEYTIDTAGILREEVFFNGKKGFYKTFDNKGVLISDDNITSLQDTDPEFSGGTIAWRSYLEHTIDIQPLIKRGILPGLYTVNVKFVVNVDGSLQNFSTIRSDIGYGIEEEAMRVMRNSPRWIPAKHLGKPVKAFRVQPIRFNISP